VFFEAQNLKVTTHFLVEFFPPALNLEFWNSWPVRLGVRSRLRLQALF
jgi:hypothetical protein